MDMDLMKLGKLIEKCKESGVSKLEIGESSVIATFYHEGENPPIFREQIIQGEKEDEITHLNAPIISGPSGLSDYDDNDDFEEKMLHLTDPAEWERKQMDSYSEKSIATGGDEESEFNHAH